MSDNYPTAGQSWLGQWQQAQILNRLFRRSRCPSSHCPAIAELAPDPIK